jgi:CubicO group peptidase (beta-lactamase class C family)
MQAYAGEMFRARGVSSVALVAKGGVIVLEQANGMASRESKEAMRTSHRFLIASLTKEWTAVATLLWAQRAQVSLDTTLATWFPTVKAWQPIRLRWLLEHRSGMVRSASAPGNAWNSEQSAARCAKERLVFEPGSLQRYSNCGYSVLGRLLELAQGASFAEVIAREVLQPLSMSQSGISKPNVAIPELAQGYTRRGSKLVRVPRAHSFGGAGGGYSTARDICNFALAGAELAGTEATRFVESHTGRLSGFDSFLALDRANDVIIVYLTNRDDTPLERVDRDLRALARGEEVSAPVR